MSADALEWLIDAELRRSPPPAVVRFAALLAQRAAGRAAAVLYYGSALADSSLDGILDFYILVDDAGAWPGPRLAALANRVLPPNVAYVETCIEGRPLRAKCAIMSLARFRRGMSAAALDTTLWARFSQPCACVWARSDDDRAAVAQALRAAAITAARWAAELGPACAAAPDYWRALFAQTYGAELRVEGASRGADLVTRNAGHYQQLLPLAWRAAGIDFGLEDDGRLRPGLAPRVRAAAARRWALRRRLGKAFNLLRLIKAAFTFEGAMDYAAWKIERHTGVRLALRPWQRRHPLLAAPGLYWRLRRLGVLR